MVVPPRLFAKGLALMKEHKYEEGLKCFKLAASAHDCKAMVCLAKAYLEGKGVDIDLVAARNWIDKAKRYGIRSKLYKKVLGALILAECSSKDRVYQSEESESDSDSDTDFSKIELPTLVCIKSGKVVKGLEPLPQAEVLPKPPDLDSFKRSVESTTEPALNTPTDLDGAPRELQMAVSITPTSSIVEDMPPAMSTPVTSNTPATFNDGSRRNLPSDLTPEVHPTCKLSLLKVKDVIPTDNNELVSKALPSELPTRDSLISYRDSIKVGLGQPTDNLSDESDSDSECVIRFGDPKQMLKEAKLLLKSQASDSQELKTSTLLLLKSSLCGDYIALYTLALCFVSGIGVKRNLCTARSLLLTARLWGHRDASSRADELRFS